MAIGIIPKIIAKLLAKSAAPKVAAKVVTKTAPKVVAKRIVSLGGKGGSKTGSKIPGVIKKTAKTAVIARPKAGIPKSKMTWAQQKAAQSPAKRAAQKAGTTRARRQAAGGAFLSGGLVGLIANRPRFDAKTAVKDALKQAAAAKSKANKSDGAKRGARQRMRVWHDQTLTAKRDAKAGLGPTPAGIDLAVGDFFKAYNALDAKGQKAVGKFATGRGAKIKARVEKRFDVGKPTAEYQELRKGRVDKKAAKDRLASASYVGNDSKIAFARADLAHQSKRIKAIKSALGRGIGAKHDRKRSAGSKKKKTQAVGTDKTQSYSVGLRRSTPK